VSEDCGNRYAHIVGVPHDDDDDDSDTVSTEYFINVWLLNGKSLKTLNMHCICMAYHTIITRIECGYLKI